LLLTGFLPQWDAKSDALAEVCGLLIAASFEVNAVHFSVTYLFIFYFLDDTIRTDHQNRP